MNTTTYGGKRTTLISLKANVNQVTIQKFLQYKQKKINFFDNYMKKEKEKEKLKKLKIKNGKEKRTKKRKLKHQKLVYL
jgi:hypothetical protein